VLLCCFNLNTFMLLALDIGNTNIVAGVYDGKRLAAQWRLATRRDLTADELAVFLKVAFDAGEIHFADVSGVVISSVVPSLTSQAKQLATTYLKCEPVVVGPKIDIGLKNKYEPPEAVGADRLVNGLAAWTKYGTAVVAVDFGTGTTVDAVSQDGHYLGGAIAPGIQIAADALFSAAARLTRVELVAPPCALGRNQTASVQSGLVYGYAGLVKELIGRCTDEVRVLGNDQITTVATGGLAEIVAPLVPAIQHVEPHLTLEGLRLIWERVQGKTAE